MQKNNFTNPLAIFDELWNAFDTIYSGFVVKGIDWDKLYHVYRNKIDEYTTENQLFDVAKNMLSHLNDNHVKLKRDKTNQHFSAGSIGYIIDKIGYDSTQKLFASKPVSNNYFPHGLNSLHGFSYGWLEDSIGYFHFGEFKNLEQTEETMHTIINYFSSSKAIIIDVRRNTGGDDRIGKTIADCFADRKRKYMITSMKNGVAHNDFADAKAWFTEPKESVQYLNPVVLLIDNTTYSAAENFALAMRELPQVSLVGDFTSGAFADADWKTLSCGWELCIPYGVFTDKNGFCWEGIGIPPNYRVKTDPTKACEEKDALIDFSLNLLNDISSKETRSDQAFEQQNLRP
jgi:C-terminal processing protease CtpA/Prc